MTDYYLRLVHRASWPLKVIRWTIGIMAYPDQTSHAGGIIFFPENKETQDNGVRMRFFWRR